MGMRFGRSGRLTGSMPRCGPSPPSPGSTNQRLVSSKDAIDPSQPCRYRTRFELGGMAISVFRAGPRRAGCVAEHRSRVSATVPEAGRWLTSQGSIAGCD